MNNFIKSLKILYRDDFYVVVDKPPGIHVHPTSLSRGERSCMQILRDQLSRRVYPVHRLDRATSGVLIFALSSEAARKLIDAFASRTIEKHYLAVVRGYPPRDGVIDYPLREDKQSTPAMAITRFRRLATIELPIAVGKFPTARYSLVEVYPITGRKNQIRKHLAHIRHPIIGDVQFGDGKHNRLFREQFSIHRLLLLATSLSFTHPFTNTLLSIRAPLPHSVRKFFEQVGWQFPEVGDV